MAIKYKFVKTLDGIDACINKAEDGVNFNTSIPYDSDNVDYQAYVEWAKTNTTEAADPGPTDWDIARAKRDTLLIDSDWTMITGATVDQAQWAAYRDKLRDIPQTYKGKATSEIVWPTAPSTKGPNS